VMGGAWEREGKMEMLPGSLALWPPAPHRSRVLLGFEARVTLDEGLRQTWEWWRECRRG
jgi:nucleoside-diphosphate-sugar epimerase